MDEIGERVLQEYFPSGSLDDETHSNAVNVNIFIRHLEFPMLINNEILDAGRWWFHILLRRYDQKTVFARVQLFLRLSKRDVV